ncbi:hypothetical protein OIU34_24000 [Pararhizobium sp. BT-229]|uniref:hypothetical protein n=1 Tax=Pararhizobium sp. BT-229 TaxID=2986923 RepID=UPI0021F7C69F|nr:hypothetical protein [Pararhizobium sp. BT-229]MCV9964962.1 hypothetical protein [Pararhizobium sp. BT-229]
MTVGGKIAKALDWTRLSLGGAMFGSLGSNVLGSSTSLGPSLKRDIVCAAIGFAVFLWMLVNEARKEARGRAASSVKFDPATTPVEKH